MTAVKAFRLAKSTSPYLRQHSKNPVDWYPWGDEAFRVARSGNKPIFLSIGYSTCHWCHVMAHESFEDEEIAGIMNDNFVNIKVDREERPDIDRQYMLYVQATTGSGGWPLSLFLSPNLTPIYGGTYFAPRDEISGGRPSFKTILEIIGQRWKDDGNNLERNGQGLVEKLKNISEIIPANSGNGGNCVGFKSIQNTFLHLQQSFDNQFAGFGQNNKFPMPGTLEMLLRYYSMWSDLRNNENEPSIYELKQYFDGSDGDEATLRAMWQETKSKGMKMATEAREMVLSTLNRMAKCGIHDQVAGGFHRYTVDRAWTLPHFEKMLYDQAQLIKLYSEAYLLFDRNPELESVVIRAIDYVKDRLLCPETRAFFSAEDADSLNNLTGKIEEGAFAVWSDEEVSELLSKSCWTSEDIEVFKYHFTILPRGNLFNLTTDSHLKNCNVLIERTDLNETDKKFNRSHEEVKTILKKGLEILKKHRSQIRPFPHRDEKIISSWNGMMISALAFASKTFQNDEYLKMAKEAAEFVKKNLLYEDSKGNLRIWRSFFDGKSSEIEGFAEDYSSIISGFIELNQLIDSDSLEYLKLAERLQSTLDNLFLDKENGGYYDSLATSDKLIRIKDYHDAVEPSSNSLTALNCLKLNLLTGKTVYMDRFKQIVKLFTEKLDKEPQGMTTLVSAIIFSTSKPVLLTLSVKESDSKHLILRKLSEQFIPHLLIKTDENLTKLGHICKGNVCSEPTNDFKILLKQILES